MTYSTEDFVRRAAGGILRGDKYRGKFVCLPCLVTMTPVRDRAGDGQGVQDSGRDHLPADIHLRPLPEDDALPRGSPSVKEARGGFRQTLHSP